MATFIALGPVYNEFGYNEQPTITSKFISCKEIPATDIRGVLDSLNFDCFVSSRCEYLHCNAMRTSIKAHMNWHKHFSKSSTSSLKKFQNVTARFKRDPLYF